MDGYKFDFNFVKAGAPIVTLSPLGMGFNPLARSLLGFPEFVKIGFDKQRCAIGIKKGSKSEDADSFEFEKKEKNGWVRLGCKDFTKYLSSISGLDFITRAKQFVARYDEENEILVVEVKKENLNKK